MAATVIFLVPAERRSTVRIARDLSEVKSALTITNESNPIKRNPFVNFYTTVTNVEFESLETRKTMCALDRGNVNSAKRSWDLDISAIYRNIFGRRINRRLILKTRKKNRNQSRHHPNSYSMILCHLKKRVNIKSTSA